MRPVALTGPSRARAGARMRGGPRRPVSRIAVVKPDKARGVEELLLRMARGGQLQGRVNEAQMVQFLEQISDQEKKTETKITVRNESESRGGAPGPVSGPRTH